MPLLEDLIEITQKTSSGAHNEIALLVNNAQHSLQEIDAVLYELLLLGHFPTAFVMSELLINSGHRSHAIGISHLVEA
jgi:hypothetical protein